MFNTETKVEQSPQSQQSPDQGVLFQVGDRQYDVTSAATKIQHADEHIARLESELKALREQASKLDKIDKLEELLMQKPSTPEPVVQPQSAAPQAQFDEDAMLQKVLAMLDSKSQEKVYQENESKAVQAARAKYGDSWQSKLKEIGTELQMSTDMITNLARTSPTAFSKMFGLSQEAGKGIPSPDSSVHIKPEQQPVRVSEILLKSGSARSRTDFVADALKNPDKYLRKE